jgi:Tol biopolymer transport system component
MSFLREIKQRKVFQVAAMYAVVAWLLIEVITSVEGPLNLPGWADTFVIVLLAIGFPVALILSWAFDVTPEGIKPARKTESGGVSSQSSVMTFTYVSQGLVLLAVAFLVVDQYLIGHDIQGPSRPAFTEVIRYNYRLQDGEALVPTPGVSIAVSPDGARIAYIGPAENGTQLWIRERNQLQSTPLPGSGDAMQPFFAPDGRGIGFITKDRQLKIISRIGDPPLTIVDEEVYRYGGAWGVDEYVYFSTESGLLRQPATGGGVPEPVTIARPEGSVVIYHGWPEVLPNGRGALFTIIRDHLADEVAVVDFSTSEIRVLAEGSLGRYAESGHLVYVRADGGFMAVPFDQDEFLITGPELLLSDQLPPGFGRDFALSRTGRLLYTKSNATFEVVWVERDGTWTPVDPDYPMQGMRYVALSPDGTRLAMNTMTRTGSDDSQIWIKDLPDGPLAQLTFEGAVNMRPSWTPDGRSVIFISDRGDNRDVWVKRSDGVTEAEVLLDDSAVVDEAFYSPSGEWLVYRRGKEDGDRDIFAIRPNLDTAPTTLVASTFDEVAPALSADSRWLAYVSDRGGQPNVYVRPFPEMDTETLVSVNGGTEPVWSRTRSELYYRNGAGEMVVVPVLPGNEFKAGSEQVLFSATEYRREFFHAAYDVAASGQRFVMVRTSESGTSDEALIVVENWFEELRRLAPTN